MTTPSTPATEIERLIATWRDPMTVTGPNRALIRTVRRECADALESLLPSLAQEREWLTTAEKWLRRDVELSRAEVVRVNGLLEAETQARHEAEQRRSEMQGFYDAAVERIRAVRREMLGGQPDDNAMATTDIATLLRESCRTAQDEAHENWQSIKRLNAELTAEREARQTLLAERHAMDRELADMNEDLTTEREARQQAERERNEAREQRNDSVEELMEWRRSLSLCESHVPEVWEGDGTCVLCEGERLAANVAGNTDLRAQLTTADHARAEMRRALAAIYDDAVGEHSDPLWIVHRDVILESQKALAASQPAGTAPAKDSKLQIYDGDDVSTWPQG